MKSVCGPALLHCYHNDEMFSKFAFQRGEYRELDLSQLDITQVTQVTLNHTDNQQQVRDYTTYMALVANSQGRGGEAALQRLQDTLGNQTWTRFCQQQS